MNDNALWTAVQARDISKDGTFVYAVTSTGVFCMPSCPSRRPKRDRVRFFETPEDAQRAGFRPCRRCHPQETPLAGVIAYISAHLGEPLTLDALGRVAGLSPAHLQRRFRARFGISPAEYIRARRAAELKAGLRNGSSVTGSMLDAGYGSTSRLYEHGTAALGMTPREYKSGGLGLVVRYDVFETALGWAVAAATERGLCRVAFDDSPESLERLLQEEFSNALLMRDRLDEYVEAVRSLAAGESRAVLVPLDVRGTAFQLKVWKALTAIPRGETRSYAKVAAEIGEPAAVRAVARACATNPVAVVIPCHRVVRSDGNLGGYRWGEARKKKLLDSEKTRPSA